MMTSKSVAYVVVAAFLGFTLISALPGQVAQYATLPIPGESLESEVQGSDDADLGSPESSTGRAPAGQEEAEAAASPSLPSGGLTEEDYEFSGSKRENITSLVFSTARWFSVNVVVAFGVYWIAKRTFS